MAGPTPPAEAIENAAAGDDVLPHHEPSILIRTLNSSGWTAWPTGGPEQFMLEWAEIGDGAGAGLDGTDR